MGKVALTEADFGLVYEAITALQQVCPLEDMIRQIFDKIRTLFNIEGVSLALHDAQRREFSFIHTVEEAAARPALGAGRIRLADHLGVAGWVLREGRSALINTPRKDRRFYKGVDLKEGFETRSMLCVPLKTRRGVIGVLYAINKLTGRFTTKELRLLEMLSGSIAVSIENAILYGELQQQANQLNRENLNLRKTLGDRFQRQGVIGSSDAMRAVFDAVDKVLDSTTTVLLQGETGTGKELIARVVHFNGPLRNKPFVAENCGALNEALLESELFGHVKGAFTGAISDCKGLFELADGGTVFLDEIAETSPAMQVKLLRVIQEGQIHRVGDRRTVHVNVRLIFSTHRNLEELVRQGRFREDLYYRIHVYPIQMPPLRDRREDVPLLADHFLRQFAKKHGRAAERINPEAMGLLMQYGWPGNVRQLENEIERAVTVAGQRKVLKPEHFSEKINPRQLPTTCRAGDGATLAEALARIERHMITDALAATGGNRSAAARRIGLTRQGLLLKMKRHGIG